MTRTDRRRSRLNPVDLGEYLGQATDPGLPHRAAHFRQHKTKTLVYTSKATLDTNAGTAYVVPRTMRIVGIALNVAGAPSSTLTCDILIDGASIFESASSKPQIASSDTASDYKSFPDRLVVPAGSALKVQLTATGSATGPMVVKIEYRDEGG